MFLEVLVRASVYPRAGATAQVEEAITVRLKELYTAACPEAGSEVALEPLTALVPALRKAAGLLPDLAPLFDTASRKLTDSQTEEVHEGRMAKLRDVLSFLQKTEVENIPFHRLEDLHNQLGAFDHADTTWRDDDEVVQFLKMSVPTCFEWLEESLKGTGKVEYQTVFALIRKLDKDVLQKLTSPPAAHLQTIHKVFS